MLLSNCTICGMKNLNFIKNKEIYNFDHIWYDSFKVNEIISKFLLTREKNMLKLHLKQPGFTYSTYGPFDKRLERIKKFWETGNLKHTHTHIYIYIYI